MLTIKILIIDLKHIFYYIERMAIPLFEELIQVMDSLFGLYRFYPNAVQFKTDVVILAWA